MNNKNFGGVIWTNHALDRLDQRGLTQDLALQTYNEPDKTMPARDGATEYQKWFDKSRVTVIVKKNERGEWLVLSNWIDPPLYGTRDFTKAAEYKVYKKSSWWVRLLYDIKNALVDLFKG